jgi:DDE superfamily endonuclease
VIVQRIDPKSPAEVNWAIRSVKSGIMATLRGWAPCGMRLPAKVPHGHWKTTTFLAALRTIVAPWVLDGPVDGESFQIYVEKVLLPTPKQGDIVIMDNLGSHRANRAGRNIRPT